MKNASHNIEETGEHKKITRPKICCIDIEDDVIKKIEGISTNLTLGTLGAKIKVPNTTRRENHELLLNYNIPPNLHEYDIIIIDLENHNTIDFVQSEHIRTQHTGNKHTSLLSSYPETLFDPRPLGSRILNGHLSNITNRPYLVIAFSAKDYEIEYQPVNNDHGYIEKQPTQTHNIYSFDGSIPKSKVKYGTEIEICSFGGDLQHLLEKHTSGATYSQTFFHSVEDKTFVPLMKNMNSDIIAYMQVGHNANLMMLPNITSKGDFLANFLVKIGPSLYPELFPFSTTFKWKENKEYWLPNHSNLLDDEVNIRNNFDKKLKENQQRKEENNNKFSFLHDLISETGDNLVKAVIRYLKWLGFEKVTNFDEIDNSSNILEEDIQVEIPEGLLIIECKGIGGTSTDSDCSQISKIKHRRSKARNKFDVSALYIVNNQRYLPPLKRQSPPFTPHQIQDAINDERGLLFTWQLFNLYFEIEEGIITKEEARNSMIQHGLVEFKPKDLILIDKPTEFFNENKVCIVNLENTELKVNEEIFAEKNGKFEKIIIVDIRKDDVPIQVESSGEVGIKFNKKVSKNTTLWKRASH